MGHAEPGTSLAAWRGLIQIQPATDGADNGGARARAAASLRTAQLLPQLEPIETLERGLVRSASTIRPACGTRATGTAALGLVSRSGKAPGQPPPAPD